jgi:hypothetical protein
MNDPHVEMLVYKVSTGKDVDYRNAKPMSEETEDFILTVDKDRAVFRMKKHFSTEEQAREIADTFLNTWRVWIGLIKCRPEELTLDFISSTIIDRSPSKNKGGAFSIDKSVTVTAEIRSNLTVRVTRNEYPQCPKNFAVSLDVETMYFRYRAYQQNREPLTTMGYWCYTVIKASTEGNPRKAAAKYSIDFRVLRKLRELTSTKGNTLEARKMPNSGVTIPLKPEEKRWIDEVIKRIIIRFGEYAFNPQAKLQKITMKDFPKLP